MVKIFLTFILFAGFITAQAQKPITLDQTLEYINKKVGPTCVVKVANGGIVIEYFKDGKEYREDRINDPKTLEVQNMEYKAEDKGFVIKCKSDEGDCIDRKIVSPKTKDQYKRTNLFYSGDQKSIDGLYNAFNHLVNLLTDLKYESSEPFE